MKKLFIIFSLIGLLAIGCQENFPVQEESSTISSEPNWVKMPEPVTAALSKTFAKSRYISARWGGSITTYAAYFTRYGYEVTAAASISFPAGIWDVEEFGSYQYITLEIDDETATSTFAPHLEFKKFAMFNAVFTGLDLSGLSEGDFDFVYQAPDGSVEQIDYARLDVDIEKGILVIVNAKIPHFSRYGFIQ